MEELGNWKQALDKLNVESELAGEGLIIEHSCYAEELTGIDPASDEGCEKLAEMTAIPLSEVKRVIQ